MRHAVRTPLILLTLLLLGGCLTSGASIAPASASLPPAALSLRGTLPRATGIQLSGRAEQGALGAQYQALQFGSVGQAVPWSADGFHGEVVPTQLYRIGSQECRGYTHTVSKGGASARQVGTACRASDNASWTPVS